MSGFKLLTFSSKEIIPCSYNLNSNNRVNILVIDATSNFVCSFTGISCFQSDAPPIIVNL